MSRTSTVSIFIGLFFLIVLNAQAGIIQSGSCNRDSIQSAIERAGAEDTVLVPPGECIWNEELVISKGIILIGAGIDSTIIKYNGPEGYNYMITVSPDLETAQNDHAVRITGFTFEKLVKIYAILRLGNSHHEYPLTKVMIDHNKFINLTTSETQFSILLNLAMFGVVHNNIIENGSHAWRYMGGLGDGRMVECWIPGSRNAMYFEDNYIYKTTSTTMLIASGGNGNRFVSRYNTIDFSACGSSAFTQLFDIHGNQPNNNGAGIGFEVYGNHFIGGVGRWFDQRAGKVFYFYNRWSGSSGNGSYFVWEEFNDDVFSTYSCEGTCYPKTASGNCVQRPYGSYYWRNFGGAEGNNLCTQCIINFDHYNREYTRNDTVIEAVINNPPIIFENQNWWRDNTAAFDGTIDPIGTSGYYGGPSCTKSGIGYGTLVQMNMITPQAEGLGFWVTDQEMDLAGMTGQNPSNPIRGTLYRSVDNTNGGYKWEAYYTPLEYPHPLREQNTPDVPEPRTNIPDGRRLRGIVEEKYPEGNLIIGATINRYHMNDSSGSILKREFSYVTPEYEFKQSAVHPDNNTWKWNDADKWIDFIDTNDMVLRIHGPVSPQCSKWAKNDARTVEELDSNMTAFLTELCKRYNGVKGFKYLDVVNETVSYNKAWNRGVSGDTAWECPWYNIGQDTDTNKTPLYIKKAFEIANQYAPDLKLIYNGNYGPERTLTWDLIKQTILYLRENGLRVDGIGWQAHVDAGWETENNIQLLRELIDWAHANNLEFHVTEASVYLKTGSAKEYVYLGYNEESLARQAATFRAILEVLIEKRNTGKVGWNTWNVCDKFGWQIATYPDKLYPYLFDTNFVAKPAYYAIQDALEKGSSVTLTSEQEKPARFALLQNYPNPFNPKTVISYKLKERSEVKLIVYDILGREVTVLVTGMKNAGTYTIEWNGRNSAGQQVGSGVYFYRLKTNDGFIETKRMLMIK